MLEWQSRLPKTGGQIDSWAELSDDLLSLRLTGVDLLVKPMVFPVDGLLLDPIPLRVERRDGSYELHLSLQKGPAAGLRSFSARELFYCSIR